MEDDRIARATRNYQQQKARYDALLDAQTRADADIERAQRTLEEVERKLPHIERRYHKAKRLYESFGDREARDRQRKRFQLLCEIAKLEGKRPPPEPPVVKDSPIPDEPETYDLVVDQAIACKGCGHVATFLDFSETLDPRDPQIKCPKCRCDRTTYVPVEDESEPLSHAEKFKEVPTVWGSKSVLTPSPEEDEG